MQDFKTGPQPVELRVFSTYRVLLVRGGAFCRANMLNPVRISLYSTLELESRPEHASSWAFGPTPVSSATSP